MFGAAIEKPQLAEIFQSDPEVSVVEEEDGRIAVTRIFPDVVSFRETPSQLSITTHYSADSATVLNTRIHDLAGDLPDFVARYTTDAGVYNSVEMAVEADGKTEITY